MEIIHKLKTKKEAENEFEFIEWIELKSIETFRNL